MLREQVRADLLAFTRRPETLFFTVFLPVIFLVLFEAIFGGQSVTLAGGDVIAQSYLQVPAFMVMGVISASFGTSRWVMKAACSSISIQRRSSTGPKASKRRVSVEMPAHDLIGYT
jgi:hypothetical protein